jgi:hypothetical protein
MPNPQAQTRKFSKTEIAWVFSVPADQIQWINSTQPKGKTMFKKRIFKAAIKLLRPIVLAIIQTEQRPGGLLANPSNIRVDRSH